MGLRILAVVLVLSAFGFAQKPRVFVTDSQSWQVRGATGGSRDGFGGATTGGARPQTAEIIKTFGERCPGVVINNRADKADYVVTLDHEGGKNWLLKDNKVAVFNSDGDSILSRSTRSLGSSVQDACGAITKDWAGRGSRPAATTQQPETPSQAATATIDISSQPAGADIEVDGSFVGNTPSSLGLPLGDHTIVVKKAGYKRWERKMKLLAGGVNIVAELEKTE